MDSDAFAKDDDDPDFCSVKWGLLGRVGSARGVQLVATHGVPNGKMINRLTSIKSVFCYSPRMPADAAIRRDGRSFQAIGPLNFYSPGVSFQLRGNGPISNALCFLNPEFLAALAETDEGFRLGDLGLLSNIESRHLTYFGREMFREATEPGFASALFAETAGMAIAVELARLDGVRRPDTKARRGGLAAWQIRRLDSYVQDQLASDLSLDELARLVGISVRQLSRVVRHEKGTSVHRWIADCRFAEARRLLTETESPIHEIARRTAFHSAAAFTTAFRAASGLTPGAFRRLRAG
jgi:AraC-like DNA-binding protein